MRIALVSEFFYPTLGGVQEHLYNVAKQYIRKGHPTSIITPQIFSKKKFRDWWPNDLPASSYIPVGHSLPFFVNGSRGRLCVGFGVGHKLKKLLTPENFDIVHLHAPLNGTLPILADHFCTTKLVGTFHTSFPGSKSLSIFRKAAQTQLNKLDRIIGVSPISIDSISQYLDVNAEIIPNGIDTEYFKPLSECPHGRVAEFNNDRPKILFMGRPDPRNGLDTLILAFGKLLKKMPEALLIVAGGGDGMQRYQQMCKFMPPDSIRFLGQVRDERADIYRSADIHVFGVEKATFSITVLEGMASGLPVITTPFKGYEALGEAGKHFLTVPFADENALCLEMERVLRDSELKKTLGLAARQHSLNFDWSRIADRLLKLYQSID